MMVGALLSLGWWVTSVSGGGGEAGVVVIGGGLAGLSASVELAEAGVKVHLIEGEKDVGGNSAKASSGINAVGTPAQASLKIKDTTSEFIHDTLKAGDEGNKRELVQILVKQSKSAVAFLTDLGVNLGDVNLCGGHSHPRTHWVPSPKEGKPIPVGIAIIRSLKSRLETLAKEAPQKVAISTLTTATRLLTNDEGRVIGVAISREGKEEEKLPASAVILTSGGFGQDHAEDSLLKEFAAAKLDYPSTNGLFAQGKGVRMGRAIGAKLRDMEHVQVHPTAFVDPADPRAKTKFLAAEALRGKGAILLNQKGQRFANELGRRDYLTGKIEASCKEDAEAKRPTAWMLMNEKAVESFGRPAFNFYFKVKKFFTAYATLDELAEGTGMDDTNLLNTFHVYQQLGEGVAEDVHGKKVFPILFKEEEGPFYAAKVTPAIHYTMGGLEIDELGRVLKEEDGSPIVGLLAAGEVSAGVHGANRLAGNSLLECVVFGRIAAKSAAQLHTKFAARTEL